MEGHRNMSFYKMDDDDIGWPVPTDQKFGIIERLMPGESKHISEQTELRRDVMAAKLEASRKGSFWQIFKRWRAMKRLRNAAYYIHVQASGSGDLKQLRSAEDAIEILCKSLRRI